MYAAPPQRTGLRIAARAAAAATAGAALAYGWRALDPQAYASLAEAALPALPAAAALAAALLATLRRLRTGQRATDRRLQALQAEYALAEELASLGSWTYDVCADRYEWSEGTFRVFGLDPASGAPSSRGFFICVHPDDQERWGKALQDSIAGGRRMDLEFRYVKNGRHVIWVRGVARPELDAGGRVTRLTGIAQDITDARALAAQLADSEAKFRDLTQLSSDWYWETDAEHRLSFLSDGAAVGLGDWVHGWLGQRDWELPAAAFPHTDWEAHRATLAARRPFDHLRLAPIKPDGTLVHLELAGRPLFDKDGRFAGYRGVGRDVTAERQQHVLLRIETAIAEILREKTEAPQVVSALLVALCDTMGWAGGLHLVKAPGRDLLEVRERSGTDAFMRMAAELPAELALTPDSVEGRCFTDAKAIWLQDVATQAAFAARYQTTQLGMSGAFLSPVLDERGQVSSALLFLSPVGFRADRFVAQAAEILSRTLSLYLQRKAAEQRLLHASLHDALTDLPNRLHLTQRLESRLHDPDAALAVLYLDLDRYKAINDTLGHTVGDEVLIEVARRMRETIRPEDVAGRIGGDEFIVLLAEARDDASVEAVARRLLAAIEKPFVLGGRAYFLSASIGVAMAPRDGTDAKLLIRCADAAMYQVKSEGRNGVRFSAATPSDTQGERQQLAAELPEALARGEIELCYQPVLGLLSRRLVGLDAQLRWRHPARGLLAPSRFAPASGQQAGLARELGRFAAVRAIAERAALGAEALDAAPVFVEVSPPSLGDEQLPDAIAEALAAHGLPASRLLVRLAESAFTEHAQQAGMLVERLRALGVQVGIDRFGTGYGSLASLRTLPVDLIRIDPAFVGGLPDDRGSAAVVRAMATLAAQLGLVAVADGAERPEQLRALRELGVQAAQGPMVALPMPAARLPEYARSLTALRQPAVAPAG